MNEKDVSGIDGFDPTPDEVERPEAPMDLTCGTLPEGADLPPVATAGEAAFAEPDAG